MNYIFIALSWRGGGGGAKREKRLQRSASHGRISVQGTADPSFQVPVKLPAETKSPHPHPFLRSDPRRWTSRHYFWFESFSENT